MTPEQFKKCAKKLPDSAGVYFFLGPRKEVLYIGKAASLRDRVRSYFTSDIAEVRSPLIARVVAKARSIAYRVTDSVLEALLLEANLIKTHKPKGNTDNKDDKSWNYVVITREDFSRVLLVRGKELSQGPSLRHGAKGRSFKEQKVFGPFPYGLQLREALKLIRKIFPYRDTCVPCMAQGPSLRQGAKGRSLKPCKPCFNSQIGLCSGMCAGRVSKQEYRKTIRHITLLFEGKKKQLIRTLEREMRAAAKAEEFEVAVQLRRQLFALQHIQDISLIKSEIRNPKSGTGYRIEAYDIAHLHGSAAVGVMTVIEDGEPKKESYRMFKIKTAKGGDDAGALREVLSRRLAHNEWPMPRLVVVDGGKAQVNAAASTLARYGVRVPVVGAVKYAHHRPRSILGNKEIIKGRERDILLANAEAHRFAISYHRKKLRRRANEVRAPGR